MSTNKYVLNVKTGTFHIRNNSKCPHSNNAVKENEFYKFYDTEDEAIAENQKYMRYCRNCFSDR